MKKTLIITGASKGIGHATAHLFQAKGWQIINISRSDSDIPGIININVDLSVTNFESSLSLALEKHLEHGIQQPICLVHNAAYHVNDSIAQQDPHELTNALSVALISPAILNQYLIPRMMAGSSIIYMGSTLAEKAVPNAASYVIAKHATVGMMRATCQDLATSNIHTCCVCPGFTNTEMLQHHLGDKPELMDLVKKRVGAERLIEPAEIAEIIYFVAGHPTINGSVLHANLGQLET
ncbi:MAG: SDR family oxidoreductase [Legionellaceae bacterium]|nr:SDR family oxidoreductase [Legionellaceae bacterium]